MKPEVYDEMVMELQRLSGLLQCLAAMGYPGLSKDFERVRALIDKATA